MRLHRAGVRLASVPRRGSPAQRRGVGVPGSVAGADVGLLQLSAGARVVTPVQDGAGQEHQAAIRPHGWTIHQGRSPTTSRKLRRQGVDGGGQRAVLDPQQHLLLRGGCIRGEQQPQWQRTTGPQRAASGVDPDAPDPRGHGPRPVPRAPVWSRQRRTRPGRPPRLPPRCRNGAAAVPAAMVRAGRTAPAGRHGPRSVSAWSSSPSERCSREVPYRPVPPNPADLFSG